MLIFIHWCSIIVAHYMVSMLSRSAEISILVGMKVISILYLNCLISFLIWLSISFVCSSSLPTIPNAMIQTCTQFNYLFISFLFQYFYLNFKIDYSSQDGGCKGDFDFKVYEGVIGQCVYVFFFQLSII